MSEFFDELMESVNQAIAIHKGEIPPSKYPVTFCASSFEAISAFFTPKIVATSLRLSWFATGKTQTTNSFGVNSTSKVLYT